MARSDYEHWNEEADYMWWQEEGRHEDQGPSDCPLCGGFHGPDEPHDDWE